MCWFNTLALLVDAGLTDYSQVNTLVLWYPSVNFCGMQATRLWMQDRVHDPALSEKGLSPTPTPRLSTLTQTPKPETLDPAP